jgi:hypothetical protein
MQQNYQFNYIYRGVELSYRKPLRLIPGSCIKKFEPDPGDSPWGQESK